MFHGRRLIHRIKIWSQIWELRVSAKIAWNVEHSVRSIPASITADHVNDINRLLVYSCVGCRACLRIHPSRDKFPNVKGLAVFEVKSAASHYPGVPTFSRTYPHISQRARTPTSDMLAEGSPKNKPWLLLCEVRNPPTRCGLRGEIPPVLQYLPEPFGGSDRPWCVVLPSWRSRLAVVLPQSFPAPSV